MLLSYHFWQVNDNPSAQIVDLSSTEHVGCGNILLFAPGTDPTWTPPFLAAVGPIMEMGGLIIHGSVVAREYGITAVVGVHEATSRLQTGQLIRVDGTSGQIVIL